MQPILFEVTDLPQQGQVSLKIEYSFEINISAEQAQRQVDRWLLNEVSYMMGADKPTLIIASPIVWQVPVYLSTPDIGRVGLVGLVKVDVCTGEMGNLPQFRTEIIKQAKRLTANLSPYHLPPAGPTEHLASTYPPAPQFVVDSQGQLKPKQTST